MEIVSSEVGREIQEKVVSFYVEGMLTLMSCFSEQVEC